MVGVRPSKKRKTNASASTAGASDSTESARTSKTREFLTPFMLELKLCYAKNRDEDDQGDPIKCTKMMKDVMTKGKIYLANESTEVAGDPKYKVYRKFLRALMICAIEDSEIPDTQSTCTHTGTYKKPQWKLLEEFVKEKRYNLIQHTFKFTEELTAPRMYQFYILMCEDTRDYDIDVGEGSKTPIIDRTTWRIHEYFGKNFYHSKNVKSHCGEAAPFLVLIKFIVDSLVWGEKERRTIDSGRTRNRSMVLVHNTYAKTAISLWNIYTSWDKYLKGLGFHDVEDLLLPFLYYDQRNGKLRILDGDLCFENSAKLELPVKKGKRLKVISLDEVIEEEEQQDEAAEIEEEEQQDGAAGIERAVKRSEMNDSETMKHIEEDVFEIIRKLASEFISDLYKDAISNAVLSMTVDEIATSSKMEKYRYSSRFYLSLNDANKVRNTLQKTRSNTQNSNLMAERASVPPPKADSTDRHSPLPSIPCGPNCKCADVKEKLRYQGGNFPVIIDSSIEEFTDKADEKINDDTIERNVQLIITDPSKFPEVKSETLAQKCAELLQDGGHVFVMTTYAQASEYTMAFKREKRSTGELVFTMDDGLFTLIARPEDEIGGIRSAGPGTKNVTKYMVHAMKMGGKDSPALHENIDLKWQGNTKTSYHANTNILDGALQLKKEKYELSLAGTREIVERYSKQGDIVVDFRCEHGWVALACISIVESRFFVGATSKEADRPAIRESLSNCIIFQAGTGEITLGMDYDDALIRGMIKVYNDHGFKDRYTIEEYGVHPWLKTRYARGLLPLLSSIPAGLLLLIAGKQYDMRLRPRSATSVSPCGMHASLGRALARTPAAEILRSAASRFGLCIDRTNVYNFEGCRTMVEREADDFIGNIYGTFVNGNWDRNKKALEEMGHGLFAIDEFIFKKKRIPVKNTTKISGLEATEKDKLYFIPYIFCPFRYAKFVTNGGNARIRFKLEKYHEVDLGQLAMHGNLEVLMKKKTTEKTQIQLDINLVL